MKAEELNHTTLYFNHHTQIVVSDTVSMIRSKLLNDPNQFLQFTEATGQGIVMEDIFINRNEILYFRKHDYSF